MPLASSPLVHRTTPAACARQIAAGKRCLSVGRRALLGLRLRQDGPAQRSHEHLGEVHGRGRHDDAHGHSYSCRHGQGLGSSLSLGERATTTTLAQPTAALPAGCARSLSDVWFTASRPPCYHMENDARGHPPPDERTVRLGKTLRVLQEHLPTLLQTPLPSEILSPNISLHLFPSTHPHLPVVSGRVAYMAALWASPLAWSRVPIVGSVRLEILSERMSKQPLHASPRRAGAGDEQLVVRWRTVRRGGGGSTGSASSMGSAPRSTPDRFDASSSASSSSSAASPSAQPSPSSPVGSSQAVDDPNEFTGLFIFEFDGDGRILSHTIEHVAEGGDWERSVGARFVGLTDWLIGNIKGSASGSGGGGGGGDNTPLPAFQIQDPRKLR